MASEPRPRATYWDYIKVRELLSLQSGFEADDAAIGQDEAVFITVHQVYELWFKIAVRDLAEARDLFKQPFVPDQELSAACRRLERLCIVFRLAVEHFPLIETLTTRDYLGFRDKLFPANGGQSAQFREVELLLGLEDAARIPYVTGGSYTEVLENSWAHDRVKARQQDKPSLKDAIDDWLHRTPIDGSTPSEKDDAAAVARFLDSYLQAHRRALDETHAFVAAQATSDAQRKELAAKYDAEHAQARAFVEAADVPPQEQPRRRRIRAAILFIEMYRELPLLAWPREVLDRLVALEQGFVHYRQRHARMAERIIGKRVGTGGSSGVDYLDAVALKYRVFRDLWAARTFLVRRELLPDPVNRSFYDFTFQR